MRTIIPKNARLLPAEAKLVFKGVLYDTYQWPQKMFDGSTKTFEMLKRFDTVKVIAVKDGKIVVEYQRQPNSPYFYDVPGGWHDREDEDELQAIKRELVEETGLKFKSWKLLDVIQPFTKIDQFVYTFLASDFESQQEPDLDGGEEIKVELFTLDDLKKLTEDPRSRYLPKKILDSVNSIDELLKLPEYKP